MCVNSSPKHRECRYLLAASSRGSRRAMCPYHCGRDLTSAASHPLIPALHFLMLSAERKKRRTILRSYFPRNSRSSFIVTQQFGTKSAPIPNGRRFWPLAASKALPRGLEPAIEPAKKPCLDLTSVPETSCSSISSLSVILTFRIKTGRRASSEINEGRQTQHFQLYTRNYEHDAEHASRARAELEQNSSRTRGDEVEARRVREEVTACSCRVTISLDETAAVRMECKSKHNRPNRSTLAQCLYQHEQTNVTAVPFEIATDQHGMVTHSAICLRIWVS